MPQHRRPTAAAALLLLLAVLFGPVVCGAGSAAYATGSGSVPAVSAHVRHPAAPTAPELRPRTDVKDTGGSCRQQDTPLKGAETAVPHTQADPLGVPGTTRTALPRTRAPQVTAPRAPPVAAACRAELLPVLRI
ncbi:hypothetical protein ACGFLS_11785 [Streptomyces abikoensis]|uniref:hypothetical protein n=1 Tax=Streptomyces abikoensis TaxID=97398 RepID=UPI0037222788